MSILCCCHHRQPAGKDTQTEAIELPTQPPRATLSKTLSRSETDMYLSSILASRAPSQLITPTYQSIVDPEAVDVEDSDDDAAEKATRQSNMGTLGVFRTKLIRRLSHRADAKAGSQPSVGTSDEELARRAELKRLMHKRIQEELKSEEEEEDIRLASLNQSSINNNKESELPGGGPRDGIEFSVGGMDDKETKNGINALPGTSRSSVVNEASQGQWQKQRSCPESVKRSINGSSHEYVSLNEMESDTRPPSPSHLTPVHILGESGRESPSTASWCLSYNSAIHIDSYIEPLVEVSQTPQPQSPEPKDSLSQQDGHTIHPQEADTTGSIKSTLQDDTINQNQTTSSEQEEDSQEEHTQGKRTENGDFSNLSEETSDGRYSPLNVWLWSQELQCASFLSSRSNSEVAFDSSRMADARDQRENSQQCDTSDNLTADASASQGHASEIWHRSSETSANEGKPSITAPSSESFASHQVFDETENIVASEGLCAKYQVQNASTQYKAKAASQQATPGRPRLGSTELPGCRRALQQLAPINGPLGLHHATASDRSGTSSYRTALNKTPSSDPPKAKLDASKLPVADILSINASETASYRQREEELRSVEKRFGLTPARRYPITPVRSKFREEFQDLKGSSSARSSILSKLYLAFPKRARVSSSQTESSKSNEWVEKQSADCHNLGKPDSSGLESHPDKLLTSNMVPSTETEERAAGLWGRTTKAGGSQYTGRLKAKLIKVSNPKVDVDTHETQPNPVRDQRLSSSKAHKASGESVCPAKHPSSSPSSPNDAAVLNEDGNQNTTDIHTGVLQEWVEQLQAEDLQQQSRAGSASNNKKQPPPRLRTPPASWARWPSHTREERTGPAREGDQVATRDFAITLNSKIFATGTGEEKKMPKGSELTTASRTLPSQVGKALKLGWNRMITHRASSGGAPGHASAAQDTRASQGLLEYPELELLPTAEAYKEVQALEQQIDSMKRRSTSRRETTPQPSNDIAKCPLASRIAEEVRKIQPEGENIDTESHTQSARSKQLLTPVQALFIPRSKPCNPEASCTIEPQCAYVECVQTQMLDDDDEDNIHQCQDHVPLKRAKSTGNIDVKLPGEGLPVDGSPHSDQTPVNKTWKSGLRRHKSLGFLSRVHHSVREKPAAAGRDKLK